MKKTFKVVASLLLVLITSTFVFAQTSGTFQGTAGTLRDDADYFMDVRYFNEVDFSNFFAWTNISSSSANLGYAKKFDELYLGAYYAGSLWYDFEKNEEEEIGSGDRLDSEKTVTGEHYFDLLFGLPEVAIKLDTYFDLNDTVTLGYKDTTKETYKNSTYGIDLTLGGISVPYENVDFKPWGCLGFKMYDNTFIYEENNDGDIYTTNDKRNSKNSFIMTLASDIEWGDKDGFFSVAGLGYTLDTAIGLNDVVRESNDSDEPKEIKAGAKDTINKINSYYRFEYTASEKVRFGGRVEIDFEFNTYCDGDTYYSGDTTPNVNDLDVKSTTNITSVLAFGMQYKLKPEFAMNVGFGADLPTFESTKTVNVTGDSMVVYSKVKSSFAPYLMAGFVWDINENCALDAYMNIGTTPKFWDSVLNGSLSLGFKYKI